MYNAIIFTGIATVRGDLHGGKIVQAPALGAFKVAHTIRQSGYSCLVINHVPDYTAQELIELLSEAIGDNTYFIGVSSTFLFNAHLQQHDRKVLPNVACGESPQSVIDFIKSKASNAKFVLGGTGATKHCNNSEIAIAVLGYSEANIANIMDHLVNGATLIDSYRSINGITIVDNPKAQGFNFQTTTMQWEDVDVVNHTKLPIEIGRGCIFKCTFCAFPMNGKQQLDFVRDVELLRTELMDNYTKFGIVTYNIVDDTFNDSTEKLIALRDMIITLPFTPTFWCYARLDLICTRPETLKILYEIGIRAMFFGIETLDSASGRKIGKGFSREKQIAMIANISETYPDMDMHGSFITGCPGETVESVMDTVRALESGEIKLNTWRAFLLFIHKVGNQPYESDITLTYTKHGYEAQSIPSKVLLDADNIINWKNSEMDFDTACELSRRFNDVSRRSANVKKQTGMRTQEPMAKELFIPAYKRKLLDLVKGKKDV